MRIGRRALARLAMEIDADFASAPRALLHKDSM